MSRVYIPSAGKFGTITGSHSHGILASLRYLHVRLDGGATVQVPEGDVAPADNVAAFPIRSIRRLAQAGAGDSGPSAA